MEPSAWLSQPDAARELRTHLGVVALLVASGHLEPAETVDQGMGVTRASVLAEHEWRRTAPRTQRWARRLRDVLRWL